jgi:hypothetical protein
LSPIGAVSIKRRENHKKNNGILGNPADQQRISFTATAVWAVRKDGKLCHNWVERSLFELFHQLRPSCLINQKR